MPRRTASLLLAAALVVPSGLVVAADSGYAQNGVPWISGGVSKEEADALRAEATRYPLQLVFTNNGEVQGAFVAEVNLRIADANGRTVLELADKGPIVLAQLPPGRYTIDAEWHGQVKHRTVDVAGPTRKVEITW